MRKFFHFGAKSGKNRKVLFAILAVLALIFGTAIWITATGLVALKNISAQNDSTAPNIKEIENSDVSKFAKEGEARVNIVIIGIGGSGHAGGQLADTIQVLSLDSVNDTYSIVSVPRDLLVTHPSGSKGKINTVYSLGDTYCKTISCPTNSDKGGVAMKSVVEKVLGLDVHYFVRIDFAGFKQVVNALGGVQVDVEKTLSDPNYPCDNDITTVCGYYQAAGKINMTGDQALKYARCRNGTCGNDFGRSERQQQLLSAVREKMLSVGTFTNPKKITDLISALGSHLKTDLSATELLTVTDQIKNANKDLVRTLVLDTAHESVLTSRNEPNIGYVIVPTAGIGKFSELHEYILRALPDPFIIKEAAEVTIIEGVGSKGAEALKDKLLNAGYKVEITKSDSVFNLTSVTLSNDVPFTSKFIKNRIQDASFKSTGSGKKIIIELKG